MPRKYQLKKRVAKLERNLKPEVKHIFAHSGEFDTIGSINGTLIRPQELAQSVGRNGRIGDSVKAKNLRFNAIMKMPSLASNPTCAVRLLVLRARSAEHVSTTNMPSWYAPVDEDKFIVVKDIMTQVSQMGTRNAGGGGDSYSTGSTLRQYKLNFKLGLRKLQYDGGSSHPPLAGETFVYLLAENQSAEVAYNWRFYYTDN